VDITNPHPTGVDKETTMNGWRRNGNSPDQNENGRHTGAEREIRIRPLGASDEEDLRVLAERDTARRPRGHVLGAERDGRLMAAISLTSGEVVADPFHPTADLVTLLRTRSGRPFPPLA
jgi:hypothetical protein